MKSKRRKKKVNKTLIKESILRIVALLMILGLNWTGLLAVGNTLSVFNDTENSAENIFSASTLYFSLDSPVGFMPEGLAAGEQSNRTIDINNEGSLNFEYKISSKDLSGDLCDYISLEANLDGDAVECADAALNGFDCSSFLFSSEEQWVFNATLSSDAPSSLEGSACNFKLAFEGWQEGFSYGAGGFTDIQEIENTIRMDSSTGPAADIVLNEIYPAPPPSSSPTPPNDREWVELYNNGSVAVDLAGWIISEMSGASEHFYTINADCSNPASDKVHPYNSTNTVISAHGWLVLEFCTEANKLNNGGDRVRLYNPGSTLSDDYTYPDTPTAKSHWRFPDGTGLWFDPEPSPGGPNIMSKQDLIDAGLDEEAIQKIVELLAERGETLIGNEAAEQPEKMALVEENVAEDEQNPDYIELIKEVVPVEETIAPEEPVVEEETVIEEIVAEETAPVEEVIEEVIIEDTPEVIVEELEQEPIIEQTPVIEPEPVVAPVEENSGPDDTPVPADDGEGESGEIAE